MGHLSFNGSRNLSEVIHANIYGKFILNTCYVKMKFVRLKLYYVYLQMKPLRESFIYRELCAVGGAFNITGLMVHSISHVFCLFEAMYIKVAGINDSLDCLPQCRQPI